MAAGFAGDACLTRESTIFWAVAASVLMLKDCITDPSAWGITAGRKVRVGFLSAADVSGFGFRVSVGLDHRLAVVLPGTTDADRGGLLGCGRKHAQVWVCQRRVAVVVSVDGNLSGNDDQKTGQAARRKEASAHRPLCPCWLLKQQPVWLWYFVVVLVEVEDLEPVVIVRRQVGAAELLGEARVGGVERGELEPR